MQKPAESTAKPRSNKGSEMDALWKRQRTVIEYLREIDHRVELLEKARKGDMVRASRASKLAAGEDHGGKVSLGRSYAP